MAEEKAAEAAVETVASDAAATAAAATGAAVVAEVNKKDAEASTTKTAAEAAVALASGAAAAATMDAAERERALVGKVETWQTEQSTRLAYLETEAKETRGIISQIFSGMERLLSTPPKPPAQVTAETAVVIPEGTKPPPENEDRTKSEEKKRPGRRMV
jgi:hypothetical protein